MFNTLFNKNSNKSFGRSFSKTRVYAAFVIIVALLLNACSSDDSTNPDSGKAPVSNAGVNQLINATAGSTIYLDGSLSTGNNAADLNYTWSFSSRPDGSSASLSSIDTVTSSFTADINGIYTVDLIVTDANLISSTSNIDIAFMPMLSYAGPDQSVKTGSTVALDGLYTLLPNLAIDGTLRFDSSGVTFLWSLLSVPAGSTAVISDSTLIDPSFVADKQGEYVVRLDVDDGFSKTSNELVVTAYDMKAMAGYDQFVEASTVQLDASGSWSLTGGLSYTWSITSMPTGSNALLSDVNAINPTFAADVEGEFIIALSVSVGALTDTDSMSVIVMQRFPEPNFPPFVDVAYGQTVKTGSLVKLDGGMTICGIPARPFPNGNIDVVGTVPPECQTVPSAVSFNWTFISRPAGSIANLIDSTTATPSFTADVAGDYTIQMERTEGDFVTTSDRIVVATDFKAMAGIDQMVDLNATVQLDGSQSWNVNGDLTYGWTFNSIPAGSNAVFSTADLVNPTFVADVAGEYFITLTVSAGALVDTADVMVFTIPSFPDYNFIPNADAGMDQTVKTASTTQLDGSASLCGFSGGVLGDRILPDGSTLPGGPAMPGCQFDSNLITFAWSIVSKPTASVATLSDPTMMSPLFDADIVGDYVIQLSLTDGANITMDTVTITATDLHASAGFDQMVDFSMPAFLDGSGSWAASGNISYRWSVLSAPAGSTATISDATTMAGIFTPDVEGDYEIGLTVSDGSVNTDSDSIFISVFNFPGIAAGN